MFPEKFTKNWERRWSQQFTEFNNYFRKQYAEIKYSYDEWVKLKSAQVCKNELFAPALKNVDDYATYLLEVPEDPTKPKKSE